MIPLLLVNPAPAAGPFQGTHSPFCKALSPGKFPFFKKKE